MTELQCPMCGIRFTGRWMTPSCEMIRRKADDMMHSANYNLIKMKDKEFKTMTDKKLIELYETVKMHPAKVVEETSKLKLYEVTVHVERPYPYETTSTHREIIVVVLAKDSTDAMSYAETSQGVARMEDMAKSTWTEIQGPFKNGTVLSARNK